MKKILMLFYASIVAFQLNSYAQEVGPLRGPDDAIATFLDAEGGSIRMKVAPWETGGVNEIWEMGWEKGIVVNYHEHYKGWETFYITKGSVEAIVAGKKMILNVGDLLHIPPYMPHGFKFLEEGTTWIAFFQGYHFFKDQQEFQAIKKNDPEKANDTDFVIEFRKKYDSHRLPPPKEN